MTAMRDAWAQAVIDVADRDEKILLLDGDLANSTKADKFAAAHPRRFVQLGIAEQNLVGVAVGLAEGGYTPWLSSFGVFFTHRALDPIRMLVAQTHANVKIAAAYTGLLTGLTGKTHHDVADLAIMRSMPGMVVIAPADADECANAVRWASEYDGPVYLRVARDAAGDFPSAAEFALGPVRRIRGGDDLTLVSTGAQSVRVLAAAGALDRHGLHASVIHIPTIKPLDEESLVDALEAAPGELVVVEDHNRYGGLGGLVCEVLNRHRINRSFRHIAVDDVWSESAANDLLLDRHGLSTDRLVAAVVNMHAADG